MKSTLAVLAGLAVLALPVLAEVTPDDRLARFQAQLAKRFQAADRNGDGRLSRAEAEAGMPRVFQYFDAIDSTGNGYLTEADILAAVRARRAARRAGGEAL